MRIRRFLVRISILLGLLELAFLPGFAQQSEGFSDFRGDLRSEIVQPKLPSVCYGATERYWVKGNNGTSQFYWRIYTLDEQGRETAIIYPFTYRNGDTVDVVWKDPDDLRIAGKYTIEVTEYPYEGVPAECIGRWQTDVIVNTSEIYIPKDLADEVEFCANEVCEINLDKLKNFEGFKHIYFPDEQGDYTISGAYYTTSTEALKVRVYSPETGCTYGLVKPVKLEIPAVDLGPDTSLFPGQTYALDGTLPRATIYEWETDNPNARWLSSLTQLTSQILVYADDGAQTVRLTVTDEKGCRGRDEVQISIRGIDEVRIPAAFTPNGDGINDTWVIPAPLHGGTVLPDVEILDVQVYDRWGNLVFKSRKNYKPWDGRDLHGQPLPMDSYHYELRIRTKDDDRLVRGSVTIVR